MGGSRPRDLLVSQASSRGHIESLKHLVDRLCKGVLHDCGRAGPGLAAERSRMKMDLERKSGNEERKPRNPPFKSFQGKENESAWEITMGKERQKGPVKLKMPKASGMGTETGSVLFYESRIHVHDVSSSNKVASRHYCILFGVELDADRSPPCPCQAVTPPTFVGSGTARPTGKCWFRRCSPAFLSALLAVADCKQRPALTQRRGSQSQPRRMGSRALTTALSRPHASQWGLYRISNLRETVFCNVKLVSYFGNRPCSALRTGKPRRKTVSFLICQQPNKANTGGDSNGPDP